MLKTVVLPAPLGPIRPTRSVAPISRSIADTAVKPPNCIVHCLRLRSVPGMTNLAHRRARLGLWNFANASTSTARAFPQRAKESLWSQQHQRDEDKRKNDHPISGDLPNDIRQPGVTGHEAQIFQQQR